jgi:hypothetical protein
MFFEHIARLQASPGSVGPSDQGRRFLARDLDFVADLAGISGWTIPQALNRLVLDRVQPRRKAAVVGTMRDDGIYILEWVAHYLALGFEHLFIYTNDNADASLELLTCLAKHGVITVFESEVTGEVPPEAKAFGHAVHLNEALYDFEWALFVDSDELLVLAPQYQHSIHMVLSALAQSYPRAEVAGICYDWLWFVSDMVFERQPGLLLERFQHARAHWLAKCVVRMKDILSMRHQHYPEVAPGFLVVDSLFKPLDLTQIWERRVAEYGGGRINHYWPRSFEEFAIKKARGASLGIENNLYDRPYETFFSWNGYESATAHYRPDAFLLHRIRTTISSLRQMDGIGALADRIERDFPRLLASVGSKEQLRSRYLAHQSDPGDL